MATENKDYKNQFTMKFLEFQLSGLEAYRKYLDQQMKLSKKKDNWALYSNYIQKEIARNNKKIEAVKEKLK